MLLFKASIMSINMSFGLWEKPGCPSRQPCGTPLPLATVCAVWLMSLRITLNPMEEQHMKKIIFHIHLVVSSTGPVTPDVSGSSTLGLDAESDT